MSLQCEVLSDRSEARQERLRAFKIAETTRATLAFTRGLMTIFGAIITRALALTKTCFTFASLGISAFAAR
jgi:hypothetical protein